MSLLLKALRLNYYLDYYNIQYNHEEKKNYHPRRLLILFCTFVGIKKAERTHFAMRSKFNGIELLQQILQIMYLICII